MDDGKFTAVEDLTHGLCALTAPDGPLSKEFYDRSVATIEGLTQATEKLLALVKTWHSINLQPHQREYCWEMYQQSPEMFEINKLLKVVRASPERT